MTTYSQHLRRWATDLLPEEVALVLRQLPRFQWFDSSSAEEGRGRHSILVASPQDWLEGSLAKPVDREWLKRALLAVELADGQDWGFPTGGLFGAVGFEGDFSFGLYDQVLVYDHGQGIWWTNGDLSDQAERLRGRSPHGSEPRPPQAPLQFSPEVDAAEFQRRVRVAQEYIASGDIYQVNLSRPFVSAWDPEADPFGLYLRLRQHSPAPHSAYIDLGHTQLLSASPELFLSLSGRQIQTRPIKGTRPRYRQPDDDERSAYELLTSAKEIAELIMITDLERNDLGQVCEFGSVQVKELLKLERFAQVFHLVSTVEGLLRPEVDHIAALAACFPGGSITGAPKRRATEIIRELETHPRGWYTGAIGWLGGNGESQLSITIRTAVVEGSTVHFHTGAGIVADSQPQAEDDETWHKAQTLLGLARPR